jgi:protein-tyrosine phosphatase
VVEPVIFGSKTPDASNGAFRILTVCTGNICRSPMAEQYLRAGLVRAGLAEVVVESAGTMAQDGQGMPDQAQALVRAHGVEPSDHRARYLFEGHVAGADLVFGMAREHRRDIVTMFPRSARYSFTLREFARLAREMTLADLGESAALPADHVSARLRAAVAAVAARRGSVDAPLDPLDDDVVDPYKRDDSVFKESGLQLVPAADVVLKLLKAAATVTPEQATS